jgi:hypothetical protein
VVAIAFVGVPGVPVVDGVVSPGVRGVPVTPPPATEVSTAAVEVPFANSSIIAIGFSADGNGETNRFGGIKVGVTAGACEYDCVQAEIIITQIKMITASLFLLYFI